MIVKLKESKRIKCVSCGRLVGQFRQSYNFKTCTAAACRRPSESAANAKYDKASCQLCVIKVFERQVLGLFKGYIADPRFSPTVNNAFVCVKDIADASTEQRQFQFGIAADLNKDYSDHKFVVVVKK